jgi:hypothetical protein
VTIPVAGAAPQSSAHVQWVLDTALRAGRTGLPVVSGPRSTPKGSSAGYPDRMSDIRGPVVSPAAGAAARTVAAGTARLLGAWCTGSPVPEAGDRRCEGTADLAARRAAVSQALFFTDEATAALACERGDETGSQEHAEVIYDGANCYIRAVAGWTGFSLADPGGPRGPNDPLWPLDALFGANGDVAEVGPDVVRGVPATRYRLTVDLSQADAALPAGVSVPAGPYRALRALPAEIWLDEVGRARRISVISDPVAPGEPVWSIVELWDFGVTADITVPGADEILTPAEAYRLTGEEPPG